MLCYVTLHCVTLYGKREATGVGLTSLAEPFKVRELSPLVMGEVRGWQSCWPGRKLTSVLQWSVGTIWLARPVASGRCDPHLIASKKMGTHSCYITRDWILPTT